MFQTNYCVISMSNDCFLLIKRLLKNVEISSLVFYKGMMFFHKEEIDLLIVSFAIFIQAYMREILNHQMMVANLLNELILIKEVSE